MRLIVQSSPTLHLSPWSPTSCRRRWYGRPQRLSLVKAEVNDATKRAKEVEGKLKEEKKVIEGRLGELENMTVDGDFEKEEFEKNKSTMQKDLDDLKNLQKELREAMQAEKSTS